MDSAGNTASAVGVNDSLLKSLRQGLKQWETSFFAAHKRKAGRDDIKQQPDIEEKYKRYNSLRHAPPHKHSTKTATPSKKRPRSSPSHVPPTEITPNKHPKITHSLHPAFIDPYDPPVSTHHSPYPNRTAIGPTPQKDGMVLGLFDNLSSGSNNRTPSKRARLRIHKDGVQATPSKNPPPSNGEDQYISEGKTRHRSPLSASRNFNQNVYSTPSINRIMKNGNTPISCKGVSKLRFDDTPNFLRRNSQRALPGQGNENDEPNVSWSPVASRKLSRPFAGKGLSALLKGLRDLEEDKLDEELDMLHQFEAGGHASRKEPGAEVLVIDSQRQDMPLGPDGGLESEDHEDLVNEGKGRDGKPLKIWKKKGQKRTTRKVVMKPSTGKWKPEPAWKASNESENEDGVPMVGDSQFALAKSDLDKQNLLGEDSDDYSRVQKNTTAKTSKEQEEGRDWYAKKVRKKISATAHANFRALKIKNKQSKAKRAGGFGRRK